jgi:16S rRNA (adenine1518-N6/adenine1519-N6)-dimethyltransferase
MHLMLQREVVERIVAPPGDKTYGRLSVMVQTYCTATSLFRIGPGAFSPAPKVDSAFLRLVPLRPLPFPPRDTKLHAQVVAAAFSQRRKTLRNSLKGLLTADEIAHTGTDPAARPETISLRQYVALADRLAANRQHAVEE